MDVNCRHGDRPAGAPGPHSYPGAIYEGTLVGVSGPAGVIKPLSATWPDAQGRFTLVLPGSAAGKPLRVWEDRLVLQTTGARPGGPGQHCDLAQDPTR